MVFRVTRGTTWTIINDVEFELDDEGNLVNAFIDPKTVAYLHVLTSSLIPLGRTNEEDCVLDRLPGRWTRCTQEALKQNL